MKIFTRFATLLIAVALLYLLWVFWSRAQDNRKVQERAAQEAAQQKVRDHQAFEGMGGNSFAILSFFASPSIIQPGEESELCYSVSNAKSVSIAPPVGDVWPAFDHCVSVKPRQTTTYTITITDAAGQTKSATAKLEVH
ncbi:MAG: hypothetical protein KGL02_00440 [Acidobacteriota bacterium]|nr:hypothetical protein [Acidobacteriota bacterium]